MSLGRREIVARLTKRLYGSPIIRNDVRGELVEEIVAATLEPDWEHCGGDWSSCDLRHASSGHRMQVKQAAARQSWAPPATIREPRFSIAYKKGRWDGAVWIEAIGRHADIFLFSWHPETDERCDHREPDQWQFHVVREPDLPPQDTISLKAVRKLSGAVLIDQLRVAVENCRKRL